MRISKELFEALEKRASVNFLYANRGTRYMDGTCEFEKKYSCTFSTGKTIFLWSIYGQYGRQETVYELSHR